MARVSSESSLGLDSSAVVALQRPGNIIFPSNLPYVADLQSAGGRTYRLETGHFVFYTREGRRFLATDPGGVPLHECEWAADGTGTRLVRARVQLDWGQWVGLKPQAMINTTVLDLSRKPGWQGLRADDLRNLAVQAMQVPLEEVRFFYGDEDLVIDAQGHATIRHKKDALYVLEVGSFEQARFMACMGAMHWAKIDFLPVVELFQSLLPGTGAAVFELIRGLYDDQNQGCARPIPLRYRGVPTYPSDAAYRLFSSFFVPSVRTGGDPLPVFMDVARAHQVSWLPTPDPPLRYFDMSQHLCITIKGQTVQKVTVMDDPSGLPFLQTAKGRPVPGDRSISVQKSHLVLRDGSEQKMLPLDATWGPLRDGPPPEAAAAIGWRAVFKESLPAVLPSDAFGAVLLYPEDDTEVDEVASQPFVADYLADLPQQTGRCTRPMSARRVLIENADAVIATCVNWDAPREYTVLYARPAYAQKQAQVIWNQLASAGRLDLLTAIAFLPMSSRAAVSAMPYDLVYLWLPFDEFTESHQLAQRLGSLRARLSTDGLAFVVGPRTVQALAGSAGFNVLTVEAVQDLPTFRMHQTILPKARLKAGLSLFHLQKP
jgi:hypothetical protein